MRLGNPATRAAVAGIRRRPRQVLLTGLAVLVATVFTAGSVLLTETLRADLVDAGVRTPDGASHVITLSSADAGALEQQLRVVPGVTDVAVGYSGVVPVVGSGTSGQWLVSSDPMAGPLTTLPAPSPGAVAGPGQVLLGSGTAGRTGLAVGDALTLGGQRFTVAGIVDLPQEPLDSLVLTPPDAASLGPVLRPARIEVAGGADTAAVRAAADGAQVRTADEQRAAEIAELSAGVGAVLAALSVFVGVAIVAAVVVVGSTFRIVLARRSRDLALLRCVGASRGQVVRSVLTEAAATGAVAGTLGVGVAVGTAYAGLAVARMSGVDAPALVVPPMWLVGCVLLAVAATVAAALAPARTAARVPPVVALGAAEATEAHPPRARLRLPVAAALVVLAALTAALGATGTEPLGALGLLALSGMVLFAALVTAGPFVIAGAAALLRRPAARSATMRLAVANAGRLSRRTAAMTTVLALGVGLTAALLTGVAGAGASARESIDRSYPSDVVIVASEAQDPAERAAAAQRLAARFDADPLLQARVAGTEVHVDAAPGADPDAARTAVGNLSGGAVAVVWTADVRAETESMLSIARLVGGALVGATLVVAVVGVGVTLALSVGERIREIALLRTFGLTRSGARRSVAAEAGLAGTVGAGLGALLGAGYGWLALGAMEMDDAGGAPWGQLLALVAGVAVVAVLASFAPMRRAGRVEPAQGVTA